jgi:hypothetical protein
VGRFPDGHPRDPPSRAGRDGWRARRVDVRFLGYRDGCIELRSALRRDIMRPIRQVRTTLLLKEFDSLSPIVGCLSPVVFSVNKAKSDESLPFGLPITELSSNT